MPPTPRTPPAAPANAQARWLMALQSADASPETDWVACRDRVEAIDKACREGTSSELNLRGVPETARHTLLRVSPDGWRALDEYFVATRGKGINSVLLPAFANDPECRRAAEFAAMLGAMPGIANMSIPCGAALSTGVSKTDLLPLAGTVTRLAPLTVTVQLPAWAYWVKIAAPDGLRVEAEAAQGRPFKATVTYRRVDAGQTRDRVVPLTFRDGQVVADGSGAASERPGPTGPGLLLPSQPSPSQPSVSGAYEQARAIARQDARAAIRQLAPSTPLQRSGSAGEGEKALRKLIQLAARLDNARPGDSAASLEYPIDLRKLLGEKDWRRLPKPQLGELEDALNRLALIRDLEMLEGASSRRRASEVGILIEKLAGLAQILRADLPRTLPGNGLFSSGLLRVLRGADHPLEAVGRRLQENDDSELRVPDQHVELLERSFISRADRDTLRARHRLGSQHKRLALELYFTLGDEIRRLVQAGSPRAASETRRRPVLITAERAGRKEDLLARKQEVFEALQTIEQIDPARERHVHWLIDRLAGAFDMLEACGGEDEEGFAKAERSCREALDALDRAVAQVQADPPPAAAPTPRRPGSRRLKSPQT